MRSSVAVPRRKRPQVSAGVLRKYRRLRRRRCLRQEYKKLRSLLPGAPRAPQLRRKVGVVDAAYQYICELQSALLAKFSTNGVPADLAGVVGGKVASASDVQALALHLIQSSNMVPPFMTTPSSRAGAPRLVPPQRAAPPSTAPPCLKGVQRTKI
ncbi:uncharacterized protein [Panulirus ornatus]|uniref:uncharacterized protein n=1 Tax=Panulirus ornatus TaxID=150431 RepID=UPI003A8B5842